MAAAVSRAHIWATVSNVEIIQSPGLLFVKRGLLEPAEPRGRRPKDIKQIPGINERILTWRHLICVLNLIYLNIKV